MYDKIHYKKKKVKKKNKKTKNRTRSSFLKMDNLEGSSKQSQNTEEKNLALFDSTLKFCVYKGELFIHF